MAKATILIVEDDLVLQEALQETLELHDYNYLLAENGEVALKVIADNTVDMVVTDVNMPGMDGLSLLHNLQRYYSHLPIILMTAFGNISDAVKAMRLGACDYLSKPFSPDVLLEKITKNLPAKKLENLDPIAADKKTNQIFALARKVALTDASVLISGESGTGKEVLARYVHKYSRHAAKPFVAINCAAIPESMLEATLFGYEKGAYTGAQKAHAGKFEQAQDGTLLLDEISEMDLGLQAKLLRVLQEHEVERLGSQKTIALNVRVIATTNRDLSECVKAGEFREDLYFRLNVFPIHWPPLRERTMDIIPLAEHLLSHYAENQKRSIPSLSKSAIDYLLAQNWPGNVREMDNLIQRALILQPGDVIEAEDLCLQMNITDPHEHDVQVPESNDKLSSDLKSREYEIILSTLENEHGSRKKVAEKLGISDRTLRYKLAKMRDLGIEVPV